MKLFLMGKFMNKDATTQILESLLAEYSKKISVKEKALKIRTWVMMLENITDEQGKAGLMKALENPGEFMPPIGKFKQMCLSGSGCDSLEDQARVAWALVIKNLNSWSSPVFKDSAIAETIRNMGGWASICSMLTEDEPWVKKDFIGIYLIMKRVDKKFPPMLRGNGEYKFIGYDSEGDKKAALLQIEQKENTDKKFLTMLGGKIKERTNL